MPELFFVLDSLSFSLECVRKLLLKIIYEKLELPIPGLKDYNDVTLREYKGLKDSMDLLEEQNDNNCDEKLSPENSALLAFVKQVISEIDLELETYNKSYPNLSRELLTSLNQLQQDPAIIIKQSDKGGNAVVMDGAQNEGMCYAILDNKQWYTKVSPLVLKRDKPIHDNLINAAYQDQIIPKTVWEYLQVPDPVIQTFYALPKVHKSLHDPPGRPIVSGNGSLTEKARRYMDYYLQDHVKNLPSYVPVHSYWA